jgi:hypothetical protein
MQLLVMDATLHSWPTRPDSWSLNRKLCSVPKWKASWVLDNKRSGIDLNFPAHLVRIEFRLDPPRLKKPRRDVSATAFITGTGKRYRRFAWRRPFVERKKLQWRTTESQFAGYGLRGCLRWF